jgi:hypothetical protein
MVTRIQSWIKYFLVWLGRCAPSRGVAALLVIFKYLELGWWMRANGMRPSPRLALREELFDLVGQAIADRPVLYLEFGVFEGVATQYWSKILRNPESRLHGFDSFEGLPEDWNSDFRKGYFSTEGLVPQIADSRVKFFKGWFHETLPAYQCPDHEVLFLNLDADIYSSTIFVLRSLRDRIVPGTYIYFDEFSHTEHEFRAFKEFMRETGMKFSVVGVANAMEHFVFKREE